MNGESGKARYFKASEMFLCGVIKSVTLLGHNILRLSYFCDTTYSICHKNKTALFLQKSNKKRHQL
ncbi:hypothetical protein, partial [Staphylococcus aureus]|uniref:hypothetical protein n=1 Tax=Staphylococcus aureus TaxID=1280 RepID=UPI00338DFD2B